MNNNFTSISSVPFLVEQFDFNKNDINIETTSATSHKSIHWKCKVCGYEWTCSAKARFSAQGKCPCHDSNKAILKGVNDVLTIVPDMKSEYDFSKNENIDIYKEGVDSGKYVYWKCNECDREWSTMIKARTRKVNGKRIFIKCPHYNTSKRKHVPFVSEVPDLMKFWDTEKNVLDPAATKSISDQSAFWACDSCGYEWEALIRNQEQSKYRNQCPCCEQNKAVKQGLNDLFSLLPEAKEYYDFEKNKDIDISSLGVKSSVTVSWKCPHCDNEWNSPIKTRIEKVGNTYRLKRCFSCYTKDVSRITPVSSSPDLLKFWDYSKNVDIDTTTTSIRSSKSAYWRCTKCNYEWEASIRGRSSSKGTCPCCEAQRAVSKDHNDILTLLPAFATIYDFDNNDNIDIYSQSPNSRKIANFRCKNCGYQWKSLISNRARKDKDGNYLLVGCPKCDNKLLRKQNYAEQYPQIASRFNHVRNTRTLESISSKESTTIKLWWNCEACGEAFESSVQSMITALNTKTKGCPYCSRTTLKKGESFADLHPDLMNEYSSDNKIDANTVFPNDKRAVMWVCTNDSSHKWEASFALRHTGLGKCPACNRTSLIKGINTFADKHPEFLHLWSPNNERKPDDIFYNSSLWFKWICDTCNGEFGAYIKDIVTGENVCPYCNDRKVLPELNSFKAKYPELLSLWSPNNLEDADSILPHTTNFYLWICPTCHGEYNAPIKNIIDGTATCPFCEDRKVLPEFNSFKARHPDLMNEWDLVNNYLLADADNISTSYNKAVWWNCPNNSTHHYYLSPANKIMYKKRKRESCPYCKGLRQNKRHFV